jgi:hypothetical protein
MEITKFAYERNHADVAAALCAARVRVIASTVAQVPGDSSVLGTAGMTNARSGSIGWSPPS